MKKLVLGTLLVLTGLLVIGLNILLISPLGIELCIVAADRFLPVQLSVESVTGRLVNRFTLNGLRFVDEENNLYIERISLAWRPGSLFHGLVDVRNMSIKGMNYVSIVADEPGEVTLPPFTLPLSVKIRKGEVDSLSLTKAVDASETSLRSIVVEDFSGDGDRFRFGDCRLEARDYGVKAQGEIRTGEVYSARLDVAYSLEMEDVPPLAGWGTLEGPLDALAFETLLSAPFPATIKGVVRDLVDKPSWEAAAEADTASLVKLDRSWPDVMLAAIRIAGEGDTESYSLKVAGSASYDIYRDIHVSGNVAGDFNGLNISGARFTYKDMEVEGHGSVSWQDRLAWQAELSAASVALALLDSSWPEVLLTEIHLAGSGIDETYSLNVATKAAYETYQDIFLTGEFSGGPDSLTMTDVRIAQEKAELKGRGVIRWQDAPEWQMDVSGSGIDPALFDSRWPGRLDLEASSSGKKIHGEIQAVIDLRQLEGELRGYPLISSGTVALDGNDLSIDRFELRSSTSVLEVSGSIANVLDLDFSVDSNDLETLWPDISGSMKAVGKLEGTRETPLLSLDLRGEKVGFAELRAAGLIASASGAVTRDDAMKITLNASEVVVGDSMFTAVATELTGTLNDHVLEAVMDSPTASARFKLAGGYAGGKWEGHIADGVLTAGQYGEWRLKDAVLVRLSEEQVDIGESCLSGPRSSLVCGDAQFATKGPWSARADIRRLPVNMFTELREPIREIQGSLTGTATARGTGSAIIESEVQLAAEGLSLRLDMAEGMSRMIEWKENSLEALFREGRADVQVRSTLRDGSLVRADAVLHDVELLPYSIDRTTIEAKLQVEILDLQPLGALTFPFVEPYGSLEGIMDVRGKLLQPEFLGTVKLREGKMIVPAFGITVEDVQMKVDGKDNLLRFGLTAGSGGGRIEADGVYSPTREDDRPFEIHLVGENFEIVNMPEARIKVSPELAVNIGKERGEVLGDILVSEAYLSSYGTRGKVQPSKDVVLVDETASRKESDWPLFADITLRTGKDVQVNAFGLKGRLDGRLQIIDMPGKVTTGKGIMEVRDGTFSIYGRQLQIVKGKLLYSENPIDNPGIEVRAENVAGSVTTGIAVSGFLQEPDISFYSSPVMEQNEIIKRLLMNTTLVGTSEEEGFIGSVASETGLDPVSSAVQGVKESLHVDEIKLETGRASDDLSLVIGTWLTPKLYVSYGQSLLEESGSFNTRYQLGLGFSLETESGMTQSGVDLKYEIER